MNNKAIPTLLIATIMIAGAFAFMPVEEASTVHATANSSSVQYAEDLTDRLAAANTDTATITIDAGATDSIFKLDSIIVCINGSNDAGGDVQLSTLVIDGATMVEGTDGSALTLTELTDGAGVDGCFDAMAQHSATNPELPRNWASNGGDIVLGLTLGDGVGGTVALTDTITSVQVIGEVVGSGTLRVVSAIT